MANPIFLYSQTTLALLGLSTTNGAAFKIYPPHKAETTTPGLSTKAKKTASMQAWEAHLSRVHTHSFSLSYTLTHTHTLYPHHTHPKPISPWSQPSPTLF